MEIVTGYQVRKRNSNWRMITLICYFLPADVSSFNFAFCQAI